MIFGLVCAATFASPSWQTSVTRLAIVIGEGQRNRRQSESTTTPAFVDDAEIQACAGTQLKFGLELAPVAALVRLLNDWAMNSCIVGL